MIYQFMQLSLLSFLYRLQRKIHEILQNAFIKSKLSKDSSMPILKGSIHWNAIDVKIGKNVVFYPGVYLSGRNIEIGDNVKIGYGTIIFSKNGVKIGNNSIIAAQCYIIDSNHGIAANSLIMEQDLETSSNGIVIGDDVWIASQCSIIKGAIIQDHAVIGANSLVNKIIPENAIAFGTPAKVSSYRM